MKEIRRVSVFAQDLLDLDPHPHTGIFSVRPVHRHISAQAHQEFMRDHAKVRISQHLRDDKPNFGLFLDSSPDRWGRLLMRRREALLAKRQARKVRALGETDYLMGVFDGTRIGGFRFKFDLEGPFLDDNAELAAPPFARLRQMEQASLHLEANDAEEGQDYGLVLDVARHFRVEAREAHSTLGDIGRIVGGWRELARDLGLGRGEQDAMASAFRLPDAATVATPVRAEGRPSPLGPCAPRDRR